MSARVKWLLWVMVAGLGLTLASPRQAAAATEGIPDVGTELTATQRHALQQLIAADPALREQVAAGITAEQIGQRRKEMETEQVAFFADQKRFVIIAYGIMWSLVVLFVLFMFLRQRRLEGTLASLEARVARASGASGADKAKT
jgi:CcmD family protein